MASPRTSVRGIKLSVGERRHPEGYCGPTQIEFDPANMGGTGAVGKGLGENTLSAQSPEEVVMEAVKDASHLYEVEWRGSHAAGAGPRVNVTQISPNQERH